MPLYLDSFRNNLPVGFSKNIELAGMESFKAILEKDFFTTVTVNNFSICENTSRLVVDLVCNLSLAEMLYHFNRGEWGNFLKKPSSLLGAITILREANREPVEMEELSIFLKDTTIIISRMYEDSIAMELKNILTELGNHYVHLTKGLKEVPYEIYVPVLEDRTTGNSENLIDRSNDTTSTNDYFGFWGQYFESEDDAVIYDLENLLHIPGDLYMLNR